MDAAILLTLLLAAGEPRRDDPLAWRIRQEGDRVEIFDRDSSRVGWGRRNPDGSLELFDARGNRLGTVEPGGRIVIYPHRPNERK